MRIWAGIQRTLQNVEWPTLIGLFGFLTLTYMSITQGHPYFALIILIIGVMFVFLAAYNSYRHKSIELVDRYEERFFVKMKQERRLAAQYLLGQYPECYELEDVIDFFEAPIADKVFSREIDEKQVYKYFRYWIILYWQAAQKHVEEFRKEDPTTWSFFEALYDRMIVLKQQQMEELLNNKCNKQDLILSQEIIKKYLTGEARLKND